MRFHYRPHRLSQPVLSLGGRLIRPRPLIQVAVLGPSGLAIERALLDTGADDTVFRETIALQIGLDLSNAPQGTASGAGQGAAVYRCAQVLLRMSDGTEHREWPAWVGFTAAPFRQALLGFAGCLQFFRATFDGELEQVDLTVNRLYPGT
jgi:hypothetical protein